jgi:hypothetical protein
VVVELILSIRHLPARCSLGDHVSQCLPTVPVPSNDLVPVRELPYGPAAPSLKSEAGQMAASDYMPIFFKNRLHLAGRPQMSARP